VQGKLSTLDINALNGLLVDIKMDNDVTGDLKMLFDNADANKNKYLKVSF